MANPLEDPRWLFGWRVQGNGWEPWVQHHHDKERICVDAEWDDETWVYRCPRCATVLTEQEVDEAMQYYNGPWDECW